MTSIIKVIIIYKIVLIHKSGRSRLPGQTIAMVFGYIRLSVSVFGKPTLFTRSATNVTASEDQFTMRSEDGGFIDSPASALYCIYIQDYFAHLVLIAGDFFIRYSLNNKQIVGIRLLWCSSRRCGPPDVGRAIRCSSRGFISS